MRWNISEALLNMADTGGLLFHGVLFFAVLAGYVSCRQAGLDFWRLADLVAPGLLLVYACGLLVGILSPAAFGTAPLPPGESGLAETWKDAAAYEALWNLTVAAIMFKRRKEQVAGALFLRSLIWHGAGLYMTEWLRPESLMWGHFRVRQLLGFVFTHAALILLWWRKKQSRPPA